MNQPEIVELIIDRLAKEMGKLEQELKQYPTSYKEGIVDGYNRAIRTIERIRNKCTKSTSG